MSNFKVGDKFRLKDQTKWGGKWAGVMTVTRLDHRYVYDDKHPEGSSAFLPKEIELVPQEPAFKVGDRVVANSTRYSFSPAGEGTVTGIRESDGFILVLLDKPTWSPGTSWSFPAKELALAPAKVEVPNPRASRASQPVNQKVLNHLKARKTISPLEALMTYGISRLAPAIHDLRAAGHVIKSELREDAKGHRYARYSLTQLAA